MILKNALCIYVQETWISRVHKLTEGLNPSNGFFPVFESAKRFLALRIYDAKPPG